MKKALAIIVLAVLLTLCFVFSMQSAFHRGVLHAIEDSELWVMETGYDPDVFILLDGDWYVHGSYTG